MTNKNKISLKESLWKALGGAPADRIALQILPDPERTAGGERITYQELKDEISRRSEELLSMGLKGKRIGILMERSIPTITFFLACLISECPAVLLDPDETRDRIVKKLERTDCALLMSVKGAEMLHGVHAKGPSEAFFLFTSGTTGEEKCVIRTQDSLRIASEFTADSMHFGPVQLLNLPLHHLAALDRLLFPALMKGCTITLSRGTGCWLGEIMTCKPEELIVVPAQALLLLGLIEENEAETFSFLRYIISTGAALPSSTKEKYAEKGIECIDVYGSSEAGCITNPAYHDGKYDLRPGSAGKLMPSLSYRISDPDPDGYGELLLNGGAVFPGYLDDEEETKSVLRNGWLHTGDLAKTDTDGFVYLNGRLKNLIILESGENVSPEELEELFLKADGIRECLCFEYRNAIAMEIVPDQNWFGSHTEIDPDEYLREKANEINGKNPSWKKVSSVYLRQEPLPRTSSGKLKRKDIPTPEADGCVLIKSYADLHSVREGLSPEDAVLSAFGHAFPGRTIRPEDDFFELGGDSLSAMRLTAELGEMGYPVSVRELFSHPCIMEFAASIRKTMTDFPLPLQKGIVAPGISGEEIDQIRAAFPDMTVEAVFPFNGSAGIKDPITDKTTRHGRGMYFLDSMLVPKKLMEEGTFHDRIKRIAVRHPVLRSKYMETSGGWRQVILKEVSIPAFYTDWSSGERTDEEKIEDAVSEYRLRYEQREKEPFPEPFSLYCYRLSEDRCVIFFELTHVSVDWLTEKLLIKELLDGPKTDSEDNYYRSWILHDHVDDKAADEAARFFEDSEKTVYKEKIRSIVPEGNGFFPRKVFTLRFEKEELLTLRTISISNHVTTTETAAYIYLQALMEIYGRDSLLFQERFDERKSMPFDSSDTAGAFFDVSFCYLRKTDKLTDYHERLARVAVHSKYCMVFLRKYMRKVPILINKLVGESLRPDNCTSVMSLKNTEAFSGRGQGIGVCEINTDGTDFIIRITYTGSDTVQKTLEPLSGCMKRMLMEMSREVQKK